MKTLYLVRHAKSSWDQEGLNDYERPLMKKGVERSQRVVQLLKERRILPELFLSSPAVRAIETARLFATGLGFPPEKIQVNHNIYEGYYDRILDIIYGIENGVASVMIFGHNPTITNLANLFLHPGIEEMPTSAVVGIAFQTDQWEELPNADVHQLFFLTPKKLR